MKAVNLLIICLSLLITAQISYAKDRDFNSVTLKITYVSGNIYMLEGMGGFVGGNIGVSAGEDGILLIDTQFVPMSDKIRTAVEGLGDDDTIRYILNPHWHRDHSNGNTAFASDTTTIIAHSNVRKRLMTSNKTMFGSVAPLAKEGWPLITFDTSLTLHFNNETITALHYPNGHTDGDTVIFFNKSNVLHMGDLFFVNVFPFIDLDNGGNVLNYTKNVAAILAKIPDDVKIIAGHGPLADKDDLRAFHTMLKNSTQFVQDKIDRGLSLNTIQEQGLPTEFESWENGFIDAETWIGLIYGSIKQP
jgi:glyoxylase-like metal-dependent hydrolase (beta-lactamase superfamily II)